MQKCKPTAPRSGTRSFAGAALLLATSVCAQVATAEDLPALKQGLWLYTTKVLAQGETNPRMRSLRKCADPTQEIKKKWEALAANACKFTPVKHEGARYTYSSSCERSGMTVLTHSAISVTSDSSYRVDMEIHGTTMVQREVMLARRLGDCTR